MLYTFYLVLQFSNIRPFEFNVVQLPICSQASGYNHPLRLKYQ
jgi:hypothetical protein